MKQELQHEKSGSSKQKVLKTEVTSRSEASKKGMSKQATMDKSQNMKSLSSVKSNSKKLNMKSLEKWSKEINLDSVRNEEEKSRKRKSDEEQKKSKSNGIKSPTQEAKRRKETTVETEKKPGKKFLVQSPSDSTTAEHRKPKPDMKLKQPKTLDASAKTLIKKPSAGATSQISVKRSKASSKSEQGKNKKQKENGTHEKLKPNVLISKVKARTKNHDPSSEKAASSRNKGQAQIATQKKPILSSLTSLVGKSKEPSARRLKIMRALGLIPPAGSPFIRTGARL